MNENVDTLTGTLSGVAGLSGAISPGQVGGGGDTGDTLSQAYAEGLINATITGDSNDAVGLKVENLVIDGPDTVESNAFIRNSYLKSVSSNTVTNIQSGAFSTAQNLESINFPNATNIQDQAFLSCPALRSVVLQSCTAFGSSVFSNCASLETVALPRYEGATSGSGTTMFSGCKQLTDIYVPALKYVPKSFLSNCQALQSLRLPAAEHIQTQAFSNCISLRDLYLGSSTMCVLEDKNIITGADISKIHVPANLEAAYKADSKWSAFADKIVGDYA